LRRDDENPYLTRAEGAGAMIVGTAVGELVRAASLRLSDCGESDGLLAHVLGVDRSWLIAHADDAVAADVAVEFRRLIARRAAGEPIAYLTGRCGFWTLDLEVTPATLIPRADTEVLVEQALGRLPVDCACTVADLGTGSGAVALAIASERPHACVVATDASETALAVARGNAGRLGLQRVTFLHGDWLAPVAAATFDLIVSNPPYVAAGDAHLGQGDLRFEPSTALAAGVDGLDAIRTIVRDARKRLVAGGCLLLEHGWDQGERVRALLEAGGYAEVFTARDLEARERVSGGRRSEAPS
jgi:release factor glutamine methyltransferase